MKKGKSKGIPKFSKIMNTQSQKSNGGVPKVNKNLGTVHYKGKC